MCCKNNLFWSAWFCSPRCSCLICTEHVLVGTDGEVPPLQLNQGNYTWSRAAAETVFLKEKGRTAWKPPGWHLEMAEVLLPPQTWCRGRDFCEETQVPQGPSTCHRVPPNQQLLSCNVDVLRLVLGRKVKSRGRIFISYIFKPKGRTRGHTG